MAKKKRSCKLLSPGRWICPGGQEAEIVGVDGKPTPEYVAWSRKHWTPEMHRQFDSPVRGTTPADAAALMVLKFELINAKEAAAIQGVDAADEANYRAALVGLKIRKERASGSEVKNAHMIFYHNAVLEVCRNKKSRAPKCVLKAIDEKTRPGLSYTLERNKITLELEGQKKKWGPISFRTFENWLSKQAL